MPAKGRTRLSPHRRFPGVHRVRTDKADASGGVSATNLGKRTGKANSGKVNSGKVNSGKVNSGKVNFGKVNFGKANFGKGDPGTSTQGRELRNANPGKVCPGQRAQWAK